MAPLVELQKGTHLDRFKKLKAEGFVRVRVDGQLYGMEDIPALDKNKKHTIDLVIDRLVIKDGIGGVWPTRWSWPCATARAGSS